MSSREVYPKWVVVEDVDGNKFIVIGMCVFHKELPRRLHHQSELKVLGGGWYKIKKDERILEFFGKSEDFGHAKVEDVKEVWESGLLFERKGKQFPVSCFDTLSFSDVETNSLKIFKK